MKSNAESLHRAQTARILPVVSGVLSIGLGATVLLGWLISSPRIVQVFPGLTPMQANTALCFVLTGGGLLGLRWRRGRLAVVLGASAVLLASAVLAQYLLGVDLHVDELLLRHTLPAFQPGTPGRMAPNTAVAFVMAGLALLLMIARRLNFGVGLLGCLVFTLGFVALAGFPFGIGHAFSWGASNQMAFHTSIGLVVIGAGIVAEAFARHPEEEQRGVRRGAMLAGVTAALIGLLFWQALRQREDHQVVQLVAQVSDGMQSEFSTRVGVVVSAVELLAQHGARLGWQSAEDWRMDAALAIGAVPEVESVEWLDADFRRRLSVVAEGEPRSKREDNAFERLQRSALEAARDTGMPVVAGPFAFADGAGFIRAFVPLRVEGRIEAYLAATIPVTETFARSRNVAPGYDIRVSCQGREVYRSAGFGGGSGEAYVQSRRVAIPGDLDWLLEVAPDSRLVDQLASPLPEVALVTGLVLALLIGSTIWFGESASWRALQFESAVAERTDELHRTMSSLRFENEQRRRGEETLQRTLAVSRLVAAEHDLTSIVQAVTDAMTELTGAAYGAFFYNVVDASGESYVLYALSGLAEGAFEGYPMPRNTALFAPTFEGKQVVRCDDVRDDSRYGHNAPHQGLPADHPMQIVSYMAVPVVSRSGKVWGGLLCGHPEPGVFTERDEQLAVGLASHAATAMDKAESLTAERRARDEAQRANAAKDRFLAVVSHELRNPLGAVRSALEVLDSATADPAAEARMRKILRRQVQQLARLVDDLLDVSRVTQGLVQMKQDRLDLVRLVRQVVMGARARMSASGLQLTGSFEDGPLWVDADSARITQALDNVLANAEKFTEAGGRIEIHVSAAEQQAEVRVVDSGCGMNAEELQRVFEPFVQVGRNFSVGTGLGLGLAIFKGLIEAHGGTVGAGSPGPGRGSTFSFRLPLQDAPEPVKRERTRNLSGIRRVLLIDDHADSLEGLQELLTVLGHDVRVARDGPSGLELAREDPPDVVVCDIGLPEMDGFEVARAMRDHPPTAEIRLIALTGFGDEASVERAREAGFDHHLTKPVDVGLLRELLAATLAGETEG